MSRNLSLIILIFVLLSCTNNQNQKEKDQVRTVVAEQLAKYPSSTLVDLYKIFFQDQFGPGHLLGDTASARAYFEWELEEMISRGRYQAEPCGLGRNFVRVPMDLVKDSLIDKEDYFRSFITSARNFSSPDVHQWHRDWNELLAVIEDMDLFLPDFEEEKFELDEMIKKGQTAVHHSEFYRRAYDPHYRIMTLEQWADLQKLIRP